METTFLIVAGIAAVLAIILYLVRDKQTSVTSSTTTSIPSVRPKKPLPGPPPMRKKVSIKQRRRVSSVGRVAPVGYFWNDQDELFDLEGLLIMGLVYDQLFSHMEVVSDIESRNEDYLQEISATEATDVPAAEPEPEPDD